MQGFFRLAALSVRMTAEGISIRIRGSEIWADSFPDEAGVKPGEDTLDLSAFLDFGVAAK